VGNEDSVQGVDWERNILQRMNKRKGNWVGHILRRNRLRRHITEGKIEGRIEVMGGRRRRKNQLDDLKEKRGYWNLKWGDTVWRIRCGRGNESVIRQTVE
jgi:hypothetical protein